MANHVILRDRLPKEVVINGRRYKINPVRRYISLTFDITEAKQSLAKTFRAPDDVYLDYMTADCDDQRRLAAFRFGWVTDAGKNAQYYQPNADEKIVYPLGSTILTTAQTPELRLANVFFPKGTIRQFIVDDVKGTPSYQVHLTLWVREVEGYAPLRAA